VARGFSWGDGLCRIGGGGEKRGGDSKEVTFASQPEKNRTTGDVDIGDQVRSRKRTDVRVQNKKIRCTGGGQGGREERLLVQSGKNGSPRAKVKTEKWKGAGWKSKRVSTIAMFPAPRYAQGEQLGKSRKRYLTGSQITIKFAHPKGQMRKDINQGRGKFRNPTNVVQGAVKKDGGRSSRVAREWIPKRRWPQERGECNNT